MEFFLGMMGACLGTALFFAGLRAGRAAPGSSPRTTMTEAEPSAEEGAFRVLQNYSVERAYGLLGGKEDV